MRVAWVADEGDDVLASRSDWVLLASGGDVLDRPLVSDVATPINGAPRTIIFRIASAAASAPPMRTVTYACGNARWSMTSMTCAPGARRSAR